MKFILLILSATLALASPPDWYYGVRLLPHISTLQAHFIAEMQRREADLRVG